MRKLLSDESRQLFFEKSSNLHVQLGKFMWSAKKVKP